MLKQIPTAANKRNNVLKLLIYTALITLSVSITLQQLISENTDYKLFSYLDEFVLAVTYAILPLVMRRISERWILVIPILPIFSIVHATIFNLINGFELRILDVVIQSVINFKFFIFFLLFYILHVTLRRSARPFKFALYAVFGVSCVGYALNIIFPNYFVFSEAVWHLERNRVSGFQFKPNDLAILLAFFYAFILFTPTKNKHKTLVAALIFFSIGYTDSRTGLGLGTLFTLSYLIINRKYNAIALGVFIGISVSTIYYHELLSTFFFSESISNIFEIFNIEYTNYIRAIIIYYGFDIALTHFPLGTGAASYATVMSLNSPIYVSLGLNTNYFFDDQVGIYDSAMAAIAGEYGFLGLTVFVAISYKIFIYIFADNKHLAYSFLFATIFLSVFQPIFSYQVNSISILLSAFSIRHALIERAAR